MTQNRTITKIAMLMLAMCLSANVMAQKYKQSDKDLVGVWLMESMQFEGEKKSVLGENYTQIKVYRANGEYACAEIAYISDTETMIVPHEYGKYTMKNGKYTENGRKGTVIMHDKMHFEGQWRNRHDVWRKTTDIPASLVDYIVDKCKHRTDPKNIQELTKKHILGAHKKK